MSNINLKHLILAIESSCDETSLCLLAVPNLFDNSKEQFDDLSLIRNTKVLASIISSQIKVHEKYGGVVPEIGARMHAEQIHFIWTEMIQKLDKSEFESIFSERLDLKCQKLDLQTQVLLLLEKIMVTTNPGLVSALRVGQEFAKSVEFFAQVARKKYEIDSKLEIMEINHLRGHMASSFFI